MSSPASISTSHSTAAAAVSAASDQKKAKDSSAGKLQPINETTYNIGLAVRAGQIQVAGKLLKENQSKINAATIKRVQELIYMPFHLNTGSDFQLLCYYKSICLQALAGDPKAQEIRDSWHTINAIVPILDRDDFLPTKISMFGVNTNSAIPIFYAYDSIYFEVATQKKETPFGEEIIFTLKPKQFLEARFDKDLFFTAKSDTKFLLFIVFLIGPRVIQGRMVNDKLEITVHRVDNHPEEDPDGEERIRGIERQAAEVLTIDRINQQQADYSQAKINEVMDFVREYFRAYQNPHSGVSLLLSQYKPTEISTRRDACFAERNPLFLYWTAKNEREHQIGENSDSYFFRFPFERNWLVYKFDKVEPTCTVVAFNDDKDRLTEFQMVFTQTDWETAAGIYLETMYRESALVTSYCYDVKSTYTLFSQGDNLFLEVFDSYGGFELYTQTGGEWARKTVCKTTITGAQDMFESRFENGYILRRSLEVVERHLENRPSALFDLSGRESYINCIWTTPEVCLPLVTIPFDNASAEDQERFGFRIKEYQKHLGLDLRAENTFSDVLAADFIRREFKKIHEPMVHDLIKLICQYVTFMPNLTQTK